MKRILSNIILAIGSAYLCPGGLHAQTNAMLANIPFDFEAGKATQSAGTYLVDGTQNHALTLRNLAATKSVMVGIVSNNEDNKGSARLTFHRYGNRYFLAEIWNANQTGTRLPMSTREKEFRTATQPSEVAAISIRCTTSGSGL